MGFVKGLLNDVWFVGISCSLIATLVAFLCSKLSSILKHRQRIASANELVVNQLRTYVINSGIPPRTTLLALRRSAARKFNVKEEEMLSILDYIEEIVSGITGNVYLKIEEQERYLHMIDSYIQQFDQETSNASLNDPPSNPKDEKIEVDLKTFEGATFHIQIAIVVSMTVLLALSYPLLSRLLDFEITSSSIQFIVPQIITISLFYFFLIFDKKLK